MEINPSDIFVEFLEIAFHYLLFINNIYPNEIFENRKKYGVGVKYSIHPAVNSHVTNCLTYVKELLSSGSLSKVIFAVLDQKGHEVRRFIFDTLTINYNCFQDQDHYLIQCEQSLRAFFLKLANSEVFSKPATEGNTFSIMIHTNESAAVNMAKTAKLEHFPFIEYKSSGGDSQDDYSITPIHTVNIDLFKVQIYAEET